MSETMALTAGHAKLEALGNGNLDTIRTIAETRVDDIFTSVLIKDIQAVDLSMRFTH